MDFLSTLALFILILFLYIYIMNQYKISEDLEIYEMDYSHNQHLQEVCEIKQPVIFQFQQINPELFSSLTPQNISKYYSYDVCVKDAYDYYNDKEDQHNVDAVDLAFGTTIKLFENDKAQHFFSDHNSDFLEESGLLKTLQSCDGYLKPNFTVLSSYDLLFGSPGAVTPLRYHNDYRKYLCVTSGSIGVKMTPWKSAKYLHPIKDYENYEFFSPVHPLHPKPEHVVDHEKTKFLEFHVNKGSVLYIPPYWFYSIVYSNEPSTFVCEITYNSIMNCVSNIPDLSLYWLQQQNITKKITKMPEKKEPVLEIIEKECAQGNETIETTSINNEPLEKKNQEFQEETQKNTENESKNETNEDAKIVQEDIIDETLAKTVAKDAIENVVQKLESNELRVHNI